MTSFRVLSLFANAGIGEYYLKSSGHRTVVANEMIKGRADFYKKLHPDTNMIQGDITNSAVFEAVIRASREANVNFILATPPCQGMSIASASGRNSKNGAEIDPRNYLIVKAIQAVQVLKPEYALFENVTQMLNATLTFGSEQVSIKSYIENALGNDYNITFAKLDAADYGIPQHRRRLFTLISKKPNIWLPPDKVSPTVSLQDSIAHLPPLESGMRSHLPWHFVRKLPQNQVEWMKRTPTGASAFDNKKVDDRPTIIDKVSGRRRLIRAFNTAYKRMRWDAPAGTVTMYSGNISSQCNVHPGRWNGSYWTDARPLTIRELSIIFGLPEDWLDEFSEHEYSEGFLRDILGEAVAPKLLQSIIDIADASAFGEMYQMAA